MKYQVYCIKGNQTVGGMIFDNERDALKHAEVLSESVFSRTFVRPVGEVLATFQNGRKGWTYSCTPDGQEVAIPELQPGE